MHTLALADVCAAQEQADQIMRPESVVHIETLGRVVDWFGPLKFSNEKKGERNIIDKVCLHSSHPMTALYPSC